MLEKKRRDFQKIWSYLYRSHKNFYVQENNIRYFKNRKYTIYTLQKKHYQYIIKKYRINCIGKKGKCRNDED